MKKIPDSISAAKFMEELRRYQNGSVSRRHFLGVTGLGLATAVMAGAVPGLRPRKRHRPLPRCQINLARNHDAHAVTLSKV